MAGNKQKLKLLYLIKIFTEDTDDQHALTLPQIVEKLGAYGISAERKTLYQDFELLRDFGFDIIGQHRPAGPAEFLLPYGQPQV